ncbi:hypothetical protein ACQWF5_24885, partial [Salmonella enterica subsp. enterica serovar Infantis]
GGPPPERKTHNNVRPGTARNPPHTNTTKGFSVEKSHKKNPKQKKKKIQMTPNKFKKLKKKLLKKKTKKKLRH